MSYCPECADLARQLNASDAECAALRQERDEWKLKYETASADETTVVRQLLKAAEADVLRLQAQVAEKDQLIHELQTSIDIQALCATCGHRSGWHDSDVDTHCCVVDDCECDRFVPPASPAPGGAPSAPQTVTTSAGNGGATYTLPQATGKLWHCRHHPTDWFHEVGCPHMTWTDDQLRDAGLLVKPSPAPSPTEEP